MIVALLVACTPKDDVPDTGLVHSCVWPQDDYCLEYNDRSEDTGVDVDEAEATCLANASYFSQDGTTEYVAGPCAHDVQGTSDAVARCVLPEEGESLIQGLRAGQPYVEIRYWYRGYAGYDFEPDPNTGADLDFLPLEATCRTDQGVFQRGTPFPDFNWFVAPEILAVGHVCTPGATPEQDVWDFTILTRGFDETNATANLWINNAETHPLTRDGTTLSLHLISATATDEAVPGVSTAYTCDMQPQMLWAVLAKRPEATWSVCAQWVGAEHDPELVPLRGMCILMEGT